MTLGDIHKIYGLCVMVGFTGGERYYWFFKDQVVSMIPASTIKEINNGKER